VGVESAAALQGVVAFVFHFKAFLMLRCAIKSITTRK
jgi:hypothetical protein